MIITLGFHCNVSNLNHSINIKRETSPFEWFQCGSLQYITDVINALTLNPSYNVVKEHKVDNANGVYLLNSGFLSWHYNINNFVSIFRRRYDRFINHINKEPTIFFVRVNSLGVNTTKNEIELFIESIKRINPNIKITILLIDTIHTDIDINYITININNVSLYHKYFLKEDVKDEYLRNSTIIHEKYKKMLEDIGYDITDVNDKSTA